jgi:hypothetical protein
MLATLEELHIDTYDPSLRLVLTCMEYVSNILRPHIYLIPFLTASTFFGTYPC